MQNIIPKNTSDNPIVFYNSAAEAYNYNIKSDLSNQRVRDETSAYFIEKVKGKTVMDFGGGTGLDLTWLIKNDYRVFFCELSPKMREVALQFQSPNLTFLQQEQTDFTKWNSNTFNEPFDGLLANFAVLNSIDNLELLFQKLASVLKPGGHIVATLIDTTFMGVARRHLKSFVVSWLKNSTPTWKTQSDGNWHCAYLHTAGAIKRAAVNFELKKAGRISGTGFMLLHLQRK